MDPQKSQVVLTLNAEVVGSLKEGVNFKKNPVDGKCYIIYKSGDDFKACKNQCKHQGGLFISDIEDLAGRWGRSNQNIGLVNMRLSSRLFASFRASVSPSRRIVRCTKHNWKLNASTMKYVNPPDSFSQDELGEFCL